MEKEDQAIPRTQTYSSSEAPPVAPRRDLVLRRYHSSNPDNRETGQATIQRPYESEFEKVNKLLRHSLNTKSKSRSHRRALDKDQTLDAGPRPRSQTYVLVQPVLTEEDNEDIYLSPCEIASVPSSKNVVRPLRSTSPLPTVNPVFNFVPDSQTQPKYGTLSTQKPDFHVETAIYGVAQGKGTNLVMELKEVQKAAYNLYGKIMSTTTNAPEMADLRTHLRTGDKAPTSDILQHIYETLQPPEPPKLQEDENCGFYLLDFRNCEDKTQLRENILLLFTTPGPPSIAYQRVTAKLDAVIHSFVEIVIAMRVKKNETITSPWHAHSILQNGGQEADHLIKVLQSNELWIRWGTETGLPPLQHVYMLKQSPSYEMRKAIVLSMVAERSDAIKKMFSSSSRPEILIPPIYSKLESEDGVKWQVAEYDPESRAIETHETSFPLWVEECPKLDAHLKSANRSKFKHGDHIYALYSVYIVIIKDITMTEGIFPKESRIPCGHQIYVGSSSTGVLYKFMNVANNHCEHIKDILDRSTMLKTFRCHQESELVEACLALSWVRRQPRAVFVINSFQEGNMAKLSLNKKKPFNDKMINLEQHYSYSKKLGPTNDMRYGLNKLGDNTINTSP